MALDFSFAWFGLTVASNPTRDSVPSGGASLLIREELPPHVQFDVSGLATLLSLNAIEKVTGS